MQAVNGRAYEILQLISFLRANVNLFCSSQNACLNKTECGGWHLHPFVCTKVVSTL